MSQVQLWMSTHENGPASTFTTPSRQLADMVQSEPEHYLGTALLERFRGVKQVPFVFKILSAGKALPLQVKIVRISRGLALTV